MKRAGILLATTFSSYLCSVFTVQAEPRQYVLDPGMSKLYVQVFKDDSTFAAALAYDHVVLATGWQGIVLVDPEKLATCVIDVTVPVAGLRADLPEMRTLVGYKKMLSDSRQKTVGKHMRAEKQLDAVNFPQITFRSQSCSGTKKELLVNGKLTIRGRSNVVTIPLQVFHSDNSIRAKGTFTAQHSDFGFSPYSALFGTVKNRPGILFVINVVGTAQ